ncbi:hypothetical protein CYY_007711 [Polysphondylium violaceum]|uniref:Protoheme IX farnesyltransferase, mitochondrial n=1 Tax=Polysphondylium violaceum TaxID=133409 RepID=A0A8J4PWT9_9MYCE|nr:hypothetical protein CYY_007711 [Polysphondylium violaceum]
MNLCNRSLGLFSRSIVQQHSSFIVANSASSCKLFTTSTFNRYNSDNSSSNSNSKSNLFINNFSNSSISYGSTLYKPHKETPYIPLFIQNKHQLYKRYNSSTSTNNATATTIPVEQQDTKKEQQQQETKEEINEILKKKPWWKRGFFDLIKFPITTYVSFTAVAGYIAACPVETFSMSTLAIVGLGTFICSASANIYNQEMEIKYDKMMPRTKYRPLITGEISRQTANRASYGLLVAGMLTLATVSPYSASLGASNILLYINYTAMKRESSFNTWVGAIVGAIPPLIGSFAATQTLEPIGALLFTYMFLWQIPHFLAIAEMIKTQYNHAGYKMLTITNPTRVKPVSLLHSLAGMLMPLGFYLYYPTINISEVTLAAMSLNFLLFMLPLTFPNIFKGKSQKIIYGISLVLLPLTLLIACIFRQPYIYYYDDDEEDEKSLVNSNSK